MRRILFFVSVYALESIAQYVSDSALFVIPLSGDNPVSVRLCRYNCSTQEMLAGPSLMSGDRFLLFCSRGYLLCDSTGTVCDSHQVAAEDSDLRLAFPLDSVSLLYYRSNGAPPRPVRVYRKRLFESMLTELTDEEYRWLGASYAGVFVNILHNALFDAQTTRLTLAPSVVGFSALVGGERYWALDREMTLWSPVLCAGADQRSTLYCGLFEGYGGRPDVGTGRPELRGMFERDGKRYWVGVHAPCDESLPRCTQTIIVCDDAGNLLWADTILKQENTDVMVGLGLQQGHTVVTLVRQPRVLAYLPVVGRNGRIYYGVVDFERRTFTVRRRECCMFRPVPVNIQPQFFATEAGIAWEPPEAAPCPYQPAGAEIPAVTVTGPDGHRRVAVVRDLTRGGFVARMARYPRRDLGAKLARGAPGLPRETAALRDSWATRDETVCPWVLSLSGPHGFVRTFAFGPADGLLCARVLGILPDSTLVVRADLRHYAEILLFTPRGAFVNRFTFNRQGHAQRRDLIAVHGDDGIVEQDFESQLQSVTLTWEPIGR